jgi:EAL domain-containing protein (putative c-di-GMP-specific phosphodiesterase class I)
MERNLFSALKNDEFILIMASALTLKTIAEGIETAAQLRISQAQRCNTGQCFYFSKPLLGKHFKDLLARELCVIRT